MPCTRMETIVKTVKKTDIPRSRYGFNGHELDLKFVYDSEEYMEIENKDAYNEETLLGQIGGFIGKNWNTKHSSKYILISSAK